MGHEFPMQAKQIHMCLQAETHPQTNPHVTQGSGNTLQERLLWRESKLFVVPRVWQAHRNRLVTLQAAVKGVYIIAQILNIPSGHGCQIPLARGILHHLQPMTMVPTKQTHLFTITNRAVG